MYASEWAWNYNVSVLCVCLGTLYSKPCFRLIRPEPNQSGRTLFLDNHVPRLGGTSVMQVLTGELQTCCMLVLRVARFLNRHH